jgi:ATP-dependent Clp protease ATP-binding subunit ClpX
VCGGAFVGLDKIVEQRLNKSGVGFGAKVKDQKELSRGELLAKTEPEDLLRFGLIPEFIGRLPVTATLGDLDEDALVQILHRPRNSLIRQYRKLFELEEVELEFTDGALFEIAREAMARRTGARGLRSILEDIMLDVMYDLPSIDDVKECIVNEETVKAKQRPILVYGSTQQKVGPVHKKVSG